MTSLDYYAIRELPSRGWSKDQFGWKHEKYFDSHFSTWEALEIEGLNYKNIY